MHKAQQWLLVGLVALFVFGLRLLPLSLTSVPEQARAQLRYQGEDGAEYVYLSGVDGYLWARHARNYLRQGTSCDAIVASECRDTYVNAPVGARMIYQRSLHIAAIVGLHRLVTFFHPAYPLLSSTFLVSVVIGVLGVVPAFFIGWRLAGTVGGLCASILSAAHPVFLTRSIGGDNDVWNVVLPLFMAWAAISACAATTQARRLVYATLAGGVVGVQAATWSGWPFSYLIVLTSLLALTLVTSGQHVLGARDLALWRVPHVRHAALVTASFYLTAGVSTIWAGVEQSALALPGSFLWSLLPSLQPLPPSAPAPNAVWPQVLTTVGELQKASFGGFVEVLYGPFFFVGSFVGLVLLMICGLTQNRLATIDRPAAIVTSVWFFAALYLSTKGVRFLLFVGPPFAFTFAVAAAWGLTVLRCLVVYYFPRQQTREPLLRYAVLALLVMFPAHRGIQTARNTLPQMTDAWWDTLTQLRDQSSADAIINTWWDYGHWTKYIAERRVTSDGASLTTHVHHWLGKALVTSSEQESLGLLRMLNCGSDATPLPEGKRGAYDKALAQLQDPILAHDFVAELAWLDKASARAALQERAFPGEAQDDLIRSTHCEPPEAYLVLSTEQMSKTRSWWHLGLWNFRAPEATPQVAAITPRWLPCRAASTGETFCTGGLPVGKQGRILEAVLYDPTSPQNSRLRFRPSFTGPFTGQPTEGSPGSVSVAGAERREEFAPLHPTFSRLGVLIDTPNQRALVGSASLVHSQFLHLMYLNGRYSQYYEKLSERTAYTGERVVVWKIHWRGKPKS